MPPRSARPSCSPSNPRTSPDGQRSRRVGSASTASRSPNGSAPSPARESLSPTRAATSATTALQLVHPDTGSRCTGTVRISRVRISRYIERVWRHRFTSFAALSITTSTARSRTSWSRRLAGAGWPPERTTPPRISHPRRGRKRTGSAPSLAWESLSRSRVPPGRHPARPPCHQPTDPFPRYSPSHYPATGTGQLHHLTRMLLEP